MLFLLYLFEPAFFLEFESSLECHRVAVVVPVEFVGESFAVLGFFDFILDVFAFGGVDAFSEFFEVGGREEFDDIHEDDFFTLVDFEDADAGDVLAVDFGGEEFVGLVVWEVETDCSEGGVEEISH